MKPSDFRPEHFQNGRYFSQADFQAYVKASEDLSKTVFTRYVPSVLAGIILGMFSSKMIGGFVGNILALILIFAGLIVGAVFNIRAGSAVKQITQRMGITKQDVAAARKHVKNGTFAWYDGEWNPDQAYQNNAQYQNNMQYQGNAQYQNNMQYQGNAQYQNNTQYQGNAQYQNNTQYQDNAQYQNNTQYQDNAQYQNNAQNQNNAQFDGRYADPYGGYNGKPYEAPQEAAVEEPYTAEEGGSAAAAEEAAQDVSGSIPYAAPQEAAINEPYTAEEGGSAAAAEEAAQDVSGSIPYEAPQEAAVETPYTDYQNGSGPYAYAQEGAYEEPYTGYYQNGFYNAPYGGNPAWQNYAPAFSPSDQRGMYPSGTLNSGFPMRAVWAAVAMAGAWILMAFVQMTFGRGFIFNVGAFYFLAAGTIGAAAYLMTRSEIQWKIISGCTGFVSVLLMSFSTMILQAMQMGMISHANLFFRFNNPAFMRAFGRGFVSVLLCLGAVLLFSVLRKKNGRKEVMLCGLISAGVYLLLHLLFQISTVRMQMSLGDYSFSRMFSSNILPLIGDAIVIFLVCLAMDYLCNMQQTEVKLRGIGLVWCWIALVGSAAGLIMVFRAAIIDSWALGASGMYIHQLPLTLCGLVGYLLLICKKRAGLYVILIGTGLMLAAQLVQGISMSAQYSAGGALILSTLVGALNPLFAWLAVRFGERKEDAGPSAGQSTM